MAEAGGIGLVGSGGDTVETLREQYAIALRKISDATVRRKLGFGINVNQIEDEFPAGTLAALVKDLAAPMHVGGLSTSLVLHLQLYSTTYLAFTVQVCLLKIFRHKEAKYLFRGRRGATYK